MTRYRNSYGPWCSFKWKNGRRKEVREISNVVPTCTWERKKTSLYYQSFGSPTTGLHGCDVSPLFLLSVSNRLSQTSTTWQCTVPHPSVIPTNRQETTPSSYYVSISINVSHIYSRHLRTNYVYNLCWSQYFFWFQRDFYFRTIEVLFPISSRLLSEEILMILRETYSFWPTKDSLRKNIEGTPDEGFILY